MRRTSKPSDDWAALLAKELAPAAPPPKGKTIEELMKIRKHAGIPASRCMTGIWIGQCLREGTLKKVEAFYRRPGSPNKKRGVYYVPVKK